MKFNNNIKEVNKIENYEGGEAFVMSPELELYSAVVTASLEDKFYEKNNFFMNRIVELISKVDPMFVAQLAIYARTQMHMRSVPLLLLVELAKIHRGDDLLSRAVEKTVLRADEITELLACYQLRNDSGNGAKKLAKLSKQIQFGLQRSFNKFDEYQFAKYERDSAEVKLRDALFLVHPKAKDDTQQIIFDKIANKNLAT
ncbi:MAG: TROVE domain-containing protein, partial [Bacteroidales bacterium]|nr:TROVE domain-containing protein [Bacteroidales bacterium]